MPLSLEDWPDPAPAGDEVVRVTGAGVCHPDTHIQDGVLDVPPPLVLGPEIAGVAEDHAAVRHSRGRRRSADPDLLRAVSGQAAFEAHEEQPRVRRFLSERERLVGHFEVDWLTPHAQAGVGESRT
jgi:threonine dehydrogenase-like Zn-dependent dehydrogenase